VSTGAARDRNWRDVVILAVDIGSSSVRACLFDGRGEPLEETASRRPHRFAPSPGGRVEADAEALFRLVTQCIDETLARASAPRAGTSGIAGVAFSTFWHGLLGVSGDGAAMTPVVTWADTRSAGQAAGLRGLLDERRILQRTGCHLHASYFPAKLLWFRETMPEVFRTVDWWCSFGEYCYFRFFGSRACSISMASGSGLFDRGEARWDAELLAALGVAEPRLSPLVDLDSPLRGLRDPYAGRWPGLKDVPWFPALGDGACSHVGCGCGGNGRASVMIGTTGAIRVLRDPGGTVPAGLWCYRVDAKRELVGGVLGDGGNLVEWIRGSLGIATPPAALDASLLAATPAGHGLTFLPFLTGERSTGWDPRARATLSGLTLQTRGLDILQAGMEAVAYRFASIRTALEESSAVTALVGTGGALLGSAAWCQILADVFEMPLMLSSATEASSRGAALLALEALGAFRHAADAPSPAGRTFTPRMEHAEAHRNAAREQERLRRQIIESAG
jgi:gluconokinase